MLDALKLSLNATAVFDFVIYIIVATLLFCTVPIRLHPNNPSQGIRAYS